MDVATVMWERLESEAPMKEGKGPAKGRVKGSLGNGFQAAVRLRNIFMDLSANRLVVIQTKKMISLGADSAPPFAGTLGAELLTHIEAGVLRSWQQFVADMGLDPERSAKLFHACTLKLIAREQNIHDRGLAFLSDEKAK